MSELSSDFNLYSEVSLDRKLHLGLHHYLHSHGNIFAYVSLSCRLKYTMLSIKIPWRTIQLPKDSTLPFKILSFLLALQLLFQKACSWRPYVTHLPGPLWYLKCTSDGTGIINIQLLLQNSFINHPKIWDSTDQSAGKQPFRSYLREKGVMNRCSSCENYVKPSFIVLKSWRFSIFLHLPQINLAIYCLLLETANCSAEVLCRCIPFQNKWKILHVLHQKL